MCYSERSVTLLLPGSSLTLDCIAKPWVRCWCRVKFKETPTINKCLLFKIQASRLITRNCKDVKSCRRNWRLYTCRGMVQLALRRNILYIYVYWFFYWSLWNPRWWRVAFGMIKSFDFVHSIVLNPLKGNWPDFDVTSPHRAVNTLRLGYTNQSMLYREIMAVCSEIHTKHINIFKYPVRTAQ